MSVNLPHTGARRAAAVLVALLLTTSALVCAASTAAAASYRFWGYYTWSDGTWSFSTKGPDQTKPADGSVEGWRFAVSPESGSPRVPRADGDFAAICKGTQPAAGKKRVAVVIDSGLPADAPSGDKPPAPSGSCAVVDEAASGADVLAAVASARIGGGLVCAIDSYPSKGCGEQVDATPPASPDAQVELALPQQSETARPAAGSSGDDDGGGLPWPGIALGAALVVGVGGAAAVRARSGART